jgi:hypothetical protein
MVGHDVLRQGALRGQGPQLVGHGAKEARGSDQCGQESEESQGIEKPAGVLGMRDKIRIPEEGTLAEGEDERMPEVECEAEARRA